MSAIFEPFRRYARWLHLQWPAGTVESLPAVNEDHGTNVPGLYVIGDLAGSPLLKLSADSGVRTVRALNAEPAFARQRESKATGVIDLVIVGAGVSGMAAALEARRQGLDFKVLEAQLPFQTIADFPKGKPIYTYPREMTPAGEMQFQATVKEDLLDELRRQTDQVEVTAGHVVEVTRSGGLLEAKLKDGTAIQALRVIVAIGRSGNFRTLGVPGEDSDKVHHRLHDPGAYTGQNVLVIGGGDSAVESTIALAECGATVTLSFRGTRLTRPKPDNLDKLERLVADGAPGGSPRLELGTTVRQITPDEVALARGAEDFTIANDVVFSMIGREAPLDFFRRSGVPIPGEWNARRLAGLLAFLVFCFALYNWKSGGFLEAWNRTAGLFPFNLTITLMLVQVLPLFLLPEIFLPWLDAHGWLPQWIADPLFPVVDYGHGREFWRAYGLILAWPLNVYNVFTDSPLWAWLIIGFAQTFVLIPALVFYYGKGAYCGWICSCGALAETLGDTQRHKMPHGPGWNRLNMAGQVILAIAFALLALRVAAWAFPDWIGLREFNSLALWQSNLGYKWTVDVLLAGIVGYGLYFWYSGRVWCRFFCPLAALMHIYARFSRFRILADKKKCISCNVCTTVCHQGIDVMSFANRGRPMQDPECVRCSACVASCPTGVLSFGQVDRQGKVIKTDRLQASLVQIQEG